MAPPICDITFDDNHHGVYLAGQTVSGQVELSLSKAKKVRSMYLKITGSASVKWSESKGNGKSVVCSGREEYASYQQIFLRAAEEDELQEVEIGEGVHRFRFSYKLPENSPTSFEGDFGFIRYTIRIVLERPWKFDLTYKIAFTVVNQLDLNKVSPPLNVATVQENMKQFSCGPCRSAPMIMTAFIPMTGYVPGQLILVTVDVANKSKKDINEIKIKLRRQVKYVSQSPTVNTKSVFCTLVKYQCSGVNRNRSAGYERRLLIPPEPPSRSVSIIQIEYFIEVIAKVPGLYMSPRLKIPITIGTVPLTKLNQSQERSSAIEASQGSSSATNLSTQFLSSSSLQSLKIPHSYEESLSRVEVNIHDEDEGRQTLGAKPFTPRYPVYRFQLQQQEQQPQRQQSSETQDC
ncbi:arrestin domain-containing protein 3-like [Uranotaenia lowii]|uniref:arrestin domain-containing protein 3-like n=1 Tax=Uranotaenia lowii TaxID=190385 RepID=UPI00247A13E9|nr:arrestin domain-containing protein 3-like [Uranotaenia lowii]